MEPTEMSQPHAATANAVPVAPNSGPESAPAAASSSASAQTAAPGPESVPVSLTPKAVEMVKITRQQEGIDAAHGLRIAVRGGGCSGFEYALDFEGEARANDYVYDQSGLTIYVDAVSARYLEGTSIDYVLGMSGAGFKFINPKAAGTCGCGSSFTV
ncbi:MAG TPA: iron-sulfur cluster assembly accessory protein [Thermoanaerobaculia bacterium]|nr:iron-sulfur cluster assembly accessory protein [Thermoanaerobaculia bacterium]